MPTPIEEILFKGEYKTIFFYIKSKYGFYGGIKKGRIVCWYPNRFHAKQFTSLELARDRITKLENKKLIAVGMASVDQ